MADNVTLNTGTGGAVIASDEDVGLAHHQYVKVEFGADNTQTKVTSAVGLPTDPLDRAARDMGKIDVAMGQIAHDAVATAVDPVLVGGYASAAAPADVTLDGDAVRAWMLRSGAQATVLTAAGALIGGDATNGLDVDVTRVTGTVTVADASLDNATLVDDAAFTPATTRVAMAGFEADEAATDSVDEGDAGAARMTLDRKVIVTQQPHTAGGLSIFRSLDLDETEEDVKTTAGQVYAMWITNTATATRWIKFYNDTAANVIVGTTTPVITFGIPGNTADDVSGLFGSGNGIAFGTAICVAATTGFADADVGAPGLNEVLVNIFYK